MWIWVQRTGDLLRDGQCIAAGYSGLGSGKNNPAAQELHGVGPLPVGGWLVGPPQNHPRLGAYACPLVPEFDTKTFDRSEFFIHGDSKEHPGAASHGCLVMDRDHREAIWLSGDHHLKCVAEFPTQGA